MIQDTFLVKIFASCSVEIFSYQSRINNEITGAIVAYFWGSKVKKSFFRILIISSTNLYFYIFLVIVKAYPVYMITVEPLIA